MLKTNTPYQDLADAYSTNSIRTAPSNLVRRLERLVFAVELKPAAP